MTDDLKIAIENLYSTFAIYSAKPKMDGCPCCVSNADKEKLHSKPLRKLEEEDLARYAFKAMTTWGDVDDFKHYLPRIFELLTKNFSVDASIILGKLGYGYWRTWTATEQNAIEAFLYIWWAKLIKTEFYFDKSIFIEMSKLTGNMDTLLDLWKIDFSNRSFACYVELVHDYYYDLTGKRKDFKELEQVLVDKLVNWIKRNSYRLEEGFFYFEHMDNELADKVSKTLYMYERSV